MPSLGISARVNRGDGHRGRRRPDHPILQSERSCWAPTTPTSPPEEPGTSPVSQPDLALRYPLVVTSAKWSSSVTRAWPPKLFALSSARGRRVSLGLPGYDVVGQGSAELQR